ncbi:MAG: DUF2971 domain-containing protein [Desulfobacter sp.]|nr:MAG: DUF2971 domain-containing protein [Desulfobacter sp.]
MEGWKERMVRYLFSNNPEDLNLDKGVDLKTKNTPKKLAKYFSINENTIDNLLNDTVWCADPNLFNDPYDTVLRFDIDQFSRSTILGNELLGALKHVQGFDIDKEINKNSFYKDPIKAYLEVIKNRDPLAGRERMRALEDSVIQMEMKFNVQKGSQLGKDARDTFRICCFSEDPYSMPMWYHYAERHQGFCLVYELNRSRKDIPLMANIWPVLYVKTFLDSTQYFKSKDQRQMINAIFFATIHKAYDWRAEKEWRLIVLKKNNNAGVTYPFKKPLAIYLGNEMKKENKEQLTNIAFDRQIAIYEMRPSKNEYKMEPKLISK